MFSKLEFKEKLGLEKGKHALRLPKVFSDHMVLQQGKILPIWGLSKAGATITVSFGKQKVSGKADEEGAWKIFLEPEDVSFESRELVVVSDEETLTFRDVLVGEVWLCSGQSNMEMGIKACYNGEDLVKAANHPFLRILTTVNKTSYLPCFDIDHGWDVCTPETADKGTFGGFCAIGYFFARRLMEEINAPIGIMNSSWGGTPIRSYIAPEGFAMLPGLKGDLEDVRNQRRYHEASLVAFNRDSNAWCEKTKKSLAEGDIMPPPPVAPKFPTPYENCAIYNTQIHPIIPFALRGFLWYQAEYDIIERPCPESYYQKMHALIKGWRKLWNDELPFYYVQVAPWHFTAIYTHRNEIIDAQTRSLDIPKTGMALAYDTADDLNNIHPRDKKPLAIRLANLALYEVYGKKEVQPYFPSKEKIILEGKVARVVFKNVYSGLHTADGKAPDCFEVAGKDGTFYPAEAEIKNGNVVFLRSENVSEISFVRFGRGLLDRPNLRNSAGLSANTFTTYDDKLYSLAYGKPVTSNFPTYLDCGPEYLTDGVTDNGSAWEGTALGQWAKIDLEAPTLCDTIAVFPYCDGLSSQRYTVEISLDGENWKRVGNRNSMAPNIAREEYSFPEEKIRFVKITVNYTNRLQPDEFAEIKLSLRTYASRTKGPRLNEVAVFYKGR